MQHAQAKIAIVAAAAALAVGCANDTTTDTDDTTDTTVTTTTVETTPAEDNGAAAPDSPDADPAIPPPAPADLGEGNETTTITAPDGEFELGGAILEKYNEMGGETGALGMPTSSEQDAPNDGRFATFEGGAIYWSPETDAHAVTGAIREAWEADGGPDGPLGFPTSDERTIPGGWEADFENGTIRFVDGETQVETR